MIANSHTCTSIQMRSWEKFSGAQKGIKSAINRKQNSSTKQYGAHVEMAISESSFQKCLSCLCPHDNPTLFMHFKEQYMG